ncbi:MAG: hypothetical protein WBQ17_14765 [Rhizomicrobium sp.]
MKRLPLAIVAVAVLFSCPALAAVSIAANQKAAICGKRTICAVLAIHHAVANTPMVHGIAVFVPDAVVMDGKCAIRNARLNIQ